MKNIEKYEEEILEILICVLGLKDGFPVSCSSLHCDDCDFLVKGCFDGVRDWLFAEYEEPSKGEDK